MNLNSKIYIAGHRGMVGSAILRNLQSQGYTNIVYATSSELNLMDQLAVNDFFVSHRPEYVFMAAAKVGGIIANNTYRADFLYENLQMQNNVIHGAYQSGVQKLLFLGSSCIYPKLAPQPLKEEYLLTGLLEPTNEPYAIAKIAGVKMCDAYRAQYGCHFISAMPTNLYGPNDNYDLQNSHVLPALLRKFIEAKKQGLPTVTLWGTGSPYREFMHVDDCAAGCIYLMQHYDQEGHVNIGTGIDLQIKDLAALIAQVVGFEGKIVYDIDKPDGTPRKLMDVSKINALGWSANIPLDQGIEMVYQKVKDQF
ncbi:MAG: GDP-L-fucose synthase [Saprospiraceae bacterium]|jgi:GDP-L-fucose synthase|nr:GDP-L-fucose synthase [Saprospiraceae bacterium]MBK6815336.1 GDP-L-fucose synthase [Saprospiraceae bacterium]MBK7439005.1 GDP-L-fucose synthase [Saprospiraceae bacterium]MBK8778633.1 GDP-L-fucose synthase [Saprospiraceae bacterium]MBK9932534.1 GDP-L-fucose synthase [Saprospiraceae bacterium]